MGEWNINLNSENWLSIFLSISISRVLTFPRAFLSSFGPPWLSQTKWNVGASKKFSSNKNLRKAKKKSFSSE